MYVRYNPDNSIAASADWPFPDSEKVDFNVVRGYDGKLYKEGTEPVKSDEHVKEELFASLRSIRDQKLAATDYLTLPDYPISTATLNKVKAYRQTLRDITSQEGAPWDGGGEKTPWPEELKI